MVFKYKRSRRRIPRNPRSRGMVTISRRNSTLQNAIAPGASLTVRADSLALSMITAYTEFTALFDYYKIVNITINVMWMDMNPSGQATAILAPQPYVQYPFWPFVVHECRVDATVTTPTIAAMKQMPSYKRWTLRPSKMYSFNMGSPMLMDTVLTTGGTAYVMNPNRWIDTAFADTRVGCKRCLVINNSSLNPTSYEIPRTLETEYRWVIQLKDPS